MWFMFERVEIDLPHANSAVEGCHRVFQHAVGYADPTYYKLFESIQLEHSHYVNRKTKIDAGPNIVKNKKNVFVSLLAHKDCSKTSLIKIRATTCEVFGIISIWMYSWKVIYWPFVLVLETSRYWLVQNEANRKMLTLIKANIICYVLTPIASLKQGNVKKPKKLLKIAHTDIENLHRILT